MFSIPSSRRMLVPLVCLTIFILISRLFTTVWIRSHVDFDVAILSQFQHGTLTQFRRVQLIDHINPSNTFDIETKPIQNNYITPCLKCSFKLNQITGTIRIPNPIINISLTPPNSPHDPTKQYFNPTLIPLPPYSPHPYLLLSRLVTRGLHQESHICLATLCQPPHQLQNRGHNTTTIHHALSTDARPCDINDIDHLGPHGGVRCATSPQRLNIPPTPALRCHGAWTALPDIPGFHDPRVFWSGKGEPLVIVNSASQYACVGLWVVDLRAVYPELEALMGRKGEYASTNADTDGMVAQGDVRMSYPHLTEVTRNPRESRGAVEKNWILFFPVGDESWVLYDIVAPGGLKRLKEQGHDHGHGHDSGHHVDASLLAAMGERAGLAVNGSGMSRLANGSLDLGRSSGSGVVRNEGEQDHTIVAAKGQHVRRADGVDGKPKPMLRPSRTLAKLIGAGYTTPNLTAPNEASCLTSDDLLDSRGDTGHWHQGSNSLRLILCDRHDLSCLEAQSERDLVEQGKVVHFSVLHRKFSNSLDLPMRYERYVMVWEARFPFRMLGMSRYPILFAGERVQPWSKDENGLEADLEAKRWESVYFTYTPSLAWAWRRESVMQKNRETRMSHGTGYLGDEVLVGIGMDDVAQGVVKVKVDELLSCMRLCPDFEMRG